MDKKNYAKISGTILNFQTGQRLATGDQYASREFKLAEHKILTKITDSSAVSIKTLTDSKTGKVLAVVYEQMNLISQAQFNVAIKDF